MKMRSSLRCLYEGVEGALILGLGVLTWPLSRRWFYHWGSTPQERQRPWPGDQFVGPEHHAYLRAIDIAVPADHAWKWVLQFGLGRAGFYSYEILERLAGIPVRNVESIESQWQVLNVGDEIKLHPKAPGMVVGSLKTGRELSFGAQQPPKESPSKPDPVRCWSIYVEPNGTGSCRLLLRGCLEPLRRPTFAKRLALAIEEPIDFVMEQRMLRTLKRLAEAAS